MWLHVASCSVRLYARRAPHELDRAAHDELVAGGEVVGPVVVERYLPYEASGGWAKQRVRHVWVAGSTGAALGASSRVYLGYLTSLSNVSHLGYISAI